MYKKKKPKMILKNQTSKQANKRNKTTTLNKEIKRNRNA